MSKAVRVQLALAAVLLAQAAAPTAPDGKYCGTALSGGRMVQITTVFARQADGSLGGSYEFVDKGKAYPGRLSAGTAMNNGVWKFTWADHFGTGPVVMDFAPGGASFTGAWSAGGSLPHLPWNGGPCAATS